MLIINFLGKADVEYNGKKLDDQLGGKAIALICLLVLNEKRYISREKLEGYLWPDSSTEAARYNLRYNLWLIKKNIGKDENNNLFLNIDNVCCSINKSYMFECDIFNIMKFRHKEQNTIEDILKLKQLFRGDLLEGCYFKNCDELNELIIFERMRYEQWKAKILKNLVELYEREEGYDNCLDIIDEILEIEPYDEEMVLKVLDIYQKCGKSVAAITYYNNFSKMLTGSLGISPSNKLRKKYKQIRATLSDNENNINMPGLSVRKTDEHDVKAEIRIVSDCIKNIQYFWIADVIGKLAALEKGNCIKKLSDKELLDLAYIQSDILNYFDKEVSALKDYGKDIMNVRIVNAFIKLLNLICSEHCLTIIILNIGDMDDTSLNILKYLKRIQIESLCIIEE